MPLRRNLWVPPQRPAVTPGSWLTIGRFSGPEAASGNLTVDIVTNWLAGPGAESGPAEGDLVVVGITYRDTPAFTLPANWNLVATQQSSGNTVAGTASSIASAVLAWTTWTAGRSLAFTRTAGDVAVAVGMVYRGQEASPYDTGSANTLGTGVTTATTGTITTAEANELLVMYAGIARNAASDTFDAATAPSVASVAGGGMGHPVADTWLRRGTLGTSTGADCAWGIADAIKDTAGATGTLSWVCSSSARNVTIVGAFKRLN